ncbi:hypothetical protein [Acidovorax radicis]|jgi:hypothetical protein|uniref:hypothetical protein n=1 Tax=Acidovorax radicis TaxID=758826 RepID=UPI001CF8A9FC|nr:hypothetical protein [Acidovorax radicis]UCU98413.1 hypothetical protein KI609_18145 [Acidovorax radicis]
MNDNNMALLRSCRTGCKENRGAQRLFQALATAAKDTKRPLAAPHELKNVAAHYEGNLHAVDPAANGAVYPSGGSGPQALRKCGSARKAA